MLAIVYLSKPTKGFASLRLSVEVPLAAAEIFHHLSRISRELSEIRARQRRSQFVFCTQSTQQWERFLRWRALHATGLHRQTAGLPGRPSQKEREREECVHINRTRESLSVSPRRKSPARCFLILILLLIIPFTWRTQRTILSFCGSGWAGKPARPSREWVRERERLLTWSTH